jgi:hypothetical protein
MQVSTKEFAEPVLDMTAPVSASEGYTNITPMLMVG